MAENTAITKSRGNSQGTPAYAIGKAVYDATAIVATDYTEIRLGFRPLYVAWENVTDRVRLEWYDGMADNSCIKTAANGARTLEVTGGNGGITPTDTGFRVLQNATLAGILASKSCQYRAEA